MFIPKRFLFVACMRTCRRIFLYVAGGIVLLSCLLVLYCGIKRDYRKCRERAERWCAGFNLNLPRVERLVRKEASLYVYVQDPVSNALAEYAFPSVLRWEVSYVVDVKQDEPIRIISTARLEGDPGRCIARVQAHLRSPHDIE